MGINHHGRQTAALHTVAESHKVEFPPREVTCPCRPRLRVSGVRLSLGESMRRAMRIQRDRRRIRSRDLDINSTLEYLCKLLQLFKIMALEKENVLKSR